MSTNPIFLLAVFILASSGFLGFVTARHGPDWLQVLRRKMKRGAARGWYLLCNGIAWALWLALTVFFAVIMLQAGEPLIVAAFIAPLLGLLMGLAALIVTVFVLGLLLGWFLLLASIVSALRRSP